MTDTTLSNAAVFPEDKGTGLPDTDSADYSSAGHFGLLATHHEGSYVASGMNFTVDQANNNVDVSAGYAFIEVSSVDVQQDTASTYDTTLPDPMVMQVILPASVTLSADADANSDVYLAIDTSTNDNAYIRHGSSVSAPSDPSVKLGTADTSNGNTTRSNDLSKPKFRDIETTEGAFVGTTESEVSSYTGQSFDTAHGIIASAADENRSLTYLLTASDSSGGSSGVNFYRSRGTIASPSVVQDGDRIANFTAAARDGDGGWDVVSSITTRSGTPTGTNNGTVPGSLEIETQDSSGTVSTVGRATENHHWETPNGTLQHNRVTKSSDFTTSGEGYYSVDTSGGAVTATLATADAIDGLELNIKRNGGSNVSVETEGSETIDGATSQTLGSDDNSLTVVFNSDNTDWEIY